MEVPSFQLLVFLFLLFIFIALKLCKTTQRATSKLPLPPGPVKLSIIGNLLDLSGSLPHHALRNLAKKYGGIMHLQLGELSTVIITSREAAREVMRSHDADFANRPYLFSASILFYNFSDIAFSRHAAEWRLLRKICVMELLSPKRVSMFRSIREQEVRKLVEMVASCAASGLPFNLSKEGFNLTNNITCIAAFGEACKDVHSIMEISEELNETIAGYSLSDLFPSFRLLRVINGMEYKVRRLSRKLDRILENIISDHRKSKKVEGDGEEEVDFLHVLLDLQLNGNLELPLTNEAIKGTILNILLGSSDTSSTTLEWAMSELIRNPRVMKKAQEEVRKVFDKQGEVKESTGIMGELHYLRLVIKETLRLHMPGPLLLPRENDKPSEVMGYFIPAKSKVLVNAWALARDPDSWTEAETFLPERFMDGSIDYKGNNLEFIPFGAGRRMCPGISFGLANVELALANLLYHFYWKLPGGLGPEMLDMTECYGSTAKRRNHLCLIPVAHHKI